MQNDNVLRKLSNRGRLVGPGGEHPLRALLRAAGPLELVPGPELAAPPAGQPAQDLQGLEINVPARGQASIHFPQTWEAILRMSAPEINRLAVEYHDNFDISQDDPLPMRRTKLYWAACGGPC